MTNLVPKQIVDKNGVHTTRMVRPESNVSKSLTFPAPVTAPFDWREAAKEIAEIAAKGAWHNNDGYIDVAELMSFKLSPAGVKTIHERVQSLSEEDTFDFGKYMVSVLRVKEYLHQRDETMVTLIDTLPVVRQFGPPNNPGFLDFNLGKIHAIAELNAVRKGASNEDADRRAVRYLTFRFIASDGKEQAFIPNIEEEAKWFDENYEKLMPHASIIRQRGADIGWLKEIVRDSSIVPLADGLL